MSEPARVCKTCRHWVALRLLSHWGFDDFGCHYVLHPDKDGRCIDVWPRPYEEEVPRETPEHPSA